MIIYLLPILLVISLSFFKIGNLNKNSNLIHQLLFVLLAIIYCGGYMTGSDWRTYELLYESADFNKFGLYNAEKGFYIYMCLFKTFGFNFFPFLIISKFIVFLLIYKFLLKYSENFYFSVFIFLSMIGIGAIFIFIDNPLRFMLAFGIVVSSLKHLLSKSFLKFLILILVASSFHISALILIPVFFLSKKMPSNRMLAIIFIVGYIIMTPQFIAKVIETYFSFLLEYIIGYLEKMKEIKFTYINIGKTFYLLIFFFILHKRSELENRPHGKLLFSLSIWFYASFLLANVIPSFHRLMVFFFPFLILSVVSILENVKYKNLYRIALISYLLLSMVKGIYSTWAYLPYSNYFAHLLKKNIPYTERSNFNRKAYFDKTGEFPEIRPIYIENYYKEKKIISNLKNEY